MVYKIVGSSKYYHYYQYWKMLISLVNKDDI